MVLVLFISLLFLGCTQAERDNPEDPRAINYDPSFVKISSSSVEPPSSSSSYETLSSSSSDVSSSSSSSSVPSPSSSSSALLSSSSVVSSSSSVVLSSSSSVAGSSSSYEDWCTGLYVDGNAEAGMVPICLVTCAEVAGGDSKEECGSDIADRLEYYLQKRGSTEIIDLGPTANNCQSSGNVLTCYSGITIDLINGRVHVNTDGGIKKGGLRTGIYTVYVKTTDNATPPKRVASFSLVGSQTIHAVWGNLVNDETDASITNLSSIGIKETQTVVAGQLVPVAFAPGEWDGESRFLVNMEEVGASFRLNQAGMFPDEPQYAGLKVYKDAEGKEEVSPTESFKISESGYLILWVAGEDRAADDVTYDVNVSNPKSSGFNITVLQSKTKTGEKESK